MFDPVQLGAEQADHDAGFMAVVSWIKLVSIGIEYSVIGKMRRKLNEIIQI